MELQDTRPAHSIPLEEVGFRGVRRRVRLYTPKGPIDLDLEMDVLVAIGGERRGAHLSRHIEALEPEGQHSSIEEYLEGVARELLARHVYARRVAVIARTVYYVEVSFAGITSMEPVDTEVRVAMDREGSKEWSVMVGVRGMTVCPSAQETIASILGVEPARAPSHVQRVIVKGRVTTRGEMVRIEDLARALWEAPSAPSFTLLKRDQEARLILEAHSRPRFVEDVARYAAVSIARRVRGLVPGDAVIEAEVISLESIHPHDVYARASGTLSAIISAYGYLDVDHR